jgi:TM2 domain-containing membrane protein YozV
MGYAAAYPTPYPGKQYVKYVPVGISNSHSIVLGYVFWLLGFTGAHRFYFGKPLTGILWFFTFGLLGIGWLVDLFLIPSMDRAAGSRYRPGTVDYNVTWLLLMLLGVFGVHRLYQGKIITGIIYLLTFGIFGIGWIYDLLTLNEQVDLVNIGTGRTFDSSPYAKFAT